MGRSEFWSTLEVTCWGMGFKYPDYIDLHTKSDVRGQPLFEEAYVAFCAVMDLQYEKDDENGFANRN